MELLSLFSIGFLTIVLLVLVFALKRNRYWKDRGVVQLNPWPFIGDLLPVLFRQKSLSELLADACVAHPKEEVIGLYFFMSPILVVNNIELVEKVLIKDFSYFVDRNSFQPNLEKEGVHISLFNTNGNVWRGVRSKFSPMFTTGKLRGMFPQISGITNSFMSLLNKNTVNINLSDYFAKFSMEIIASTAFGIESNAMEEDSEYWKKGISFFGPSLSNFLFTALGPSIVKIFRIKMISNQYIEYYGAAVKSALTYRKETKATRNDFIQHMITLQEKGSIEIEQEDASDDILKMDEVTDVTVEMSDDLMVGHSLGFLLAGFHATTLSMQWLCYELAKRPELQVKVRQEIKEVLERHGNGLDYNNLREIKFLNNCLKESNRLHSPVGDIPRYCTKTYHFPGKSFTLKPGQPVYIPILHIHYNSDYFSDPEKFIPERWEEETQRPNCTYLTWGVGPRMCIAKRFANMEMLSCLVKLFLNFELTLHSSKNLSLRQEPYSFFNYPRAPVFFDLHPILS